MVWTDLCASDDIEADDLITLEYEGNLYAIYHTDAGEYFCSDGLCTHEQVDLGDGLLMDHIIECPKHNGRFDIRDGSPKGSPVCVALRTYPVRVENGRVLVNLAS